MDGSTSIFKCVFYDTKQCDPAIDPTCAQEEICKPHDGMRPACYAVWNNDTVGNVKLLHRGCWLAQVGTDDCTESQCVTDKPTTMARMKNSDDPATYYCCCDESTCNDKYVNIPPKDIVGGLPSRRGPTKTPSPPSMDAISIFAYVFVPVIFVAFVCLVAYWFYRRHKLAASRKQFNSPSQFQETADVSASLKSIQLIDVIAKGRYGTVWKASMADQVVAVKKFPHQDVNSWSQEHVIYTVRGLKDHENILHFIGSDVRGPDEKKEYWLVTSYKVNGSLYDYLKGHTLNMNDLLHISTGMLRGLSFLHEEIIGSGGQEYKPTIVHRDFKSRNVLLDGNLTACISDFGLSLKCSNGKMPNEVHSQVGTWRYMSPEVLEGATNFDAFAFRQIDVYAAGLVLWELLSRCSIDGEDLDEYKMPFEDEVGRKPYLKDLQEFVVSQRKRPHLRESWRMSQHGTVICSTIEELWDTEPDARVTAGCALERFLAIQHSVAQSSAKSTSTENETRNTVESVPLITESRTFKSAGTETV